MPENTSWFGSFCCWATNTTSVAEDVVPSRRNSFFGISREPLLGTCMDDGRPIKLSQTIKDHLALRVTTRVAFLVRYGSRLHHISPGHKRSVAFALRTLELDAKTDTRFIILERREAMDIFVFDLFPKRLDPPLIYLEPNPEVVLIDFGKNYCGVKLVSLTFRVRVNSAVNAHHHEQLRNGSSPPYGFDDRRRLSDVAGIYYKLPDDDPDVK